jgi:hypothetical protein
MITIAEDPAPERRLECLRIAATGIWANQNADAVVRRAAEFYRFVTNGEPCAQQDQGLTGQLTRAVEGALDSVVDRSGS